MRVVARTPDGGGGGVEKDVTWVWWGSPGEVIEFLPEQPDLAKKWT